jgi:hypothetical protein
MATSFSHPKKMNLTKNITPSVLLIATLFFCVSAKADPVTFNFTGTGINGSQASGSFTTSTALYPFYYSNGDIYSDFSLTIANIPGSGPGSVTFGLDDLQGSWLNIDGSGNVFIAPYGSHNFGGPDYHYYGLGQPSQPWYPTAFTYVTDLIYDGRYEDTITWSVATPAGSGSTVPESGSTMVLILGAAAAMAAARHCRRVLAP